MKAYGGSTVKRICVYLQCKKKMRHLLPAEKLVGLKILVWVRLITAGNSTEKIDVYILLLLNLNPELKRKISLKLLSLTF